MVNFYLRGSNLIGALARAHANAASAAAIAHVRMCSGAACRARYAARHRTWHDVARLFAWVASCIDINATTPRHVG